MSYQFDVIVVGGGVVGLSAAIGMAQRHYSVAVIDAQSLSLDLIQKSARVYAVNQSSRALFEALGVWSEVSEQDISPYRHMHIWDAQNGAFIDFDARMIGEERLGNIIAEDPIKKALLQRAIATGITLIPNSKVSSLQQLDQEVRITCEEGHYLAKLLIVSDGGLSKTRDKLGVTLTTWPYHQHAIVATVTVEHPHKATAYQVFNADGPLAFLPLKDPHACSIVWSTTPERAEHLLTVEADTFNQELTKAFAAKLGACALVDKRHQFPLVMRHANQYQGTRWMLMGDAAHTIHPLAGLGLNLGLEDVASWLGIMDKAKSPCLSGRYLREYQRARKYEVWKIIGMMEGLKTLFANSLPPIAMARGVGLKLCNQLPAAKRFFINQAGGNKF
ncbi:FAD-dependent oxidoreductase [Legionella yabuuchiae]|uniref:FAD-dependent oxidoreductase n=1 Tax=Legionella yabuuchiae TaxID=376727 RepID=UPI0010548897|nr:FAD-dependent oxidoreductase [Legionella yabuuchiae]